MTLQTSLRCWPTWPGFWDAQRLEQSGSEISGEHAVDVEGERVICHL